MWWLICLIICIVFGLWFCFSGWGDFEDFVVGFFIGVLGSILFLLLSLFVSFSSAPTYETAPVPLGALADSNLVEGSSFLGRGTIDEELTYTFVTGDYTEGFEVKQVKAINCTIKYTEKAPYYTKGRQKLNWYGRFVWGVDSVEVEEYTFYVPEGTIIQNYNIDLQ